MTNAGVRLVRGYRLLLAAFIRTAGVVALLGVAALIISVPLWFLATKTPILFNYLVLAALVSGGFSVLIRRKSKGLSLSGIAFAFIGVVTVALLLLGYYIPAVAAVVILSGFSAWRVAKR